MSPEKLNRAVMGGASLDDGTGRYVLTLPIFGERGYCYRFIHGFSKSNSAGWWAKALKFDVELRVERRPWRQGRGKSPEYSVAVLYTASGSTLLHHLIAYMDGWLARDGYVPYKGVRETKAASRGSR